MANPDARNPAGANGGARENVSAGERHEISTAVRTAAQEQRRRFFYARARELAQRSEIGELTFIDAVDMAYTAAVWSGLADDIGDDEVQRLLAAAFREKRGAP
jgi:hypothetical protein